MKPKPNHPATRPTEQRISLFLALVFIIGFGSCKKPELVQQDSEAFAHAGKETCDDCDFLSYAYADINDHPTTVGDEIKNPYLLPNMRQAYYNINGHYPSTEFPITHLYVKFSPKDFGRLDELEEENIELYDYPLHRRLITEGDYFVQPGKDLEDIPEYYAVVSADYRFPTGISYSVIDRMYIPDDEPALEDEALRLTDNLDDNPTNIENTSRQPLVKEMDYSNSASQETSTTKFADIDCGRYPSGKITVQNELAGDKSSRGVRKVKVVLRRLFKTETIVTDEKGNFASEKYFRNKYSIIVKFKNGLARISRMRPWAIHEQFFPIKINFGKWSNLTCNHEFSIAHPKATGTIATSHWCAAVTHNGVQEHREMSLQEKIGVPPTALNIMLSQVKGSGNGNTYMLNKILKSNGLVSGVEGLITAVATLWSPIGAVTFLVATEAYKKRAPDVKFGYGGDAEFLTTDRYCELVYHELSHASHYKRVGNSWWLKLGIAESKNPGEGTYGECCTNYSPCIAVAEGWAYFMGHYLADKKWKEASTSFPEQGDLQRMTNLQTFTTQNGTSSHINFLESYNPKLDHDPNRWIPKGLMYDLIDPAAESFANSGINDRVSSITCEEIYTAMSSDVESMDEFRIKLIRLNKLNESAEITSLFKQYGY